jgi:hypothetical protein
VSTWTRFVGKYDETFWRRVSGRVTTSQILGTLRRIVENQEQKVTLSLTDSLAEHDVLEAILEDSKPSLIGRRGVSRLDYLLRSPWRYPPLPWGSRFGQRFEPSLLYGALSHEALFAEAAYYRFVFLEGMQKPFKERVIIQFTVFEAMFQTSAGLNLTQAPFKKHEEVLRHKSDYRPCQNLGRVLRDKGIEAIIYLSARTREHELNVALFSPAALRSRKHRNPRHVLCETRVNQVTFRLGSDQYDFPRENFLVNGQLPIPA